MPQSELEATFLYYWRAINGPPLTPEYRFDPKRRYRLDFAYVPAKVAIECEGGTWTQGRHSRGNGYTQDCIKYNLATADGWRIFRLTSDMLANNPYEHLTLIKLFIEANQ
jgi:very-short-patch-repair endonuclease